MLNQPFPQLWPFFQLTKIDEITLPTMINTGVPELRQLVARMIARERIYCTEDRKLCADHTQTTPSVVHDLTVDPFELDEADKYEHQYTDTSAPQNPFLDSKSKRDWTKACVDNGWPRHCFTDAAYTAFPKALGCCSRLHCTGVHVGDITTEFPDGVEAFDKAMKESAMTIFAKLKGREAGKKGGRASGRPRGRGRNRRGRGRGRGGRGKKRKRATTVAPRALR